MYILKLNNDAFYTGITNDISKRLKKHSEGKGSKYVRSHLPFKFVYKEIFLTKKDALKREIEIKRLTHHQKKCLIENKT